MIYKLTYEVQLPSMNQIIDSNRKNKFVAAKEKKAIHQTHRILNQGTDEEEHREKGGHKLPLVCEKQDDRQRQHSGRNKVPARRIAGSTGNKKRRVEGNRKHFSFLRSRQGQPEN